ncbi:hypothetical protein BKA93DRAFT_751236 [Sparassis latifolia]
MTRGSFGLHHFRRSMPPSWWMSHGRNRMGERRSSSVWQQEHSYTGAVTPVDPAPVLQGASSTKPRLKPQAPWTWYGRQFGTFDPHSLDPRDFMDLSTIMAPCVSDRTQRTQLYFGSTHKSVLFPPDTRGFLYYHSPTDWSPLLGEIRFRLAQGSDVVNFALGKDLLWPQNGLPWRIMLFHIARAENYRPFREVLLRDKLVTPDVMDKCTRWPARMPHDACQIIQSLDDLIYFDFSALNTAFCVLIGKDDLRRVMTRSLFCDFRSDVRTTPYIGSAFCRFERTADQSLGLHLRVVKIREPAKLKLPDYDGYISMPVEGELLVRGGKPWTIYSKTRSVYIDALRDKLKWETEGGAKDRP